ncbi:hypothetical protein [Rhizobium sp. MHM7A]|uniref:hypothetical protein n=1 Tax=Rhizobium sp. MHM7A TaxID=2583233 RepID=UPI00110732E9|nr:hypothetical protein [Rhizobium sp. MHM7A]TLX16168.1 hypothetical protein FFR93_02245 [Rhizobium sp. MHM7A]
MSAKPVSRLAFVSNPDVEAILVETEVLDADAFQLTFDLVEIVSKDGTITARGDPGIYGRKLLEGRSEIRIASLPMSFRRTYEIIPKRLSSTQA